MTNSIIQQFHSVKDVIGADSALGYTLNKAKVEELFSYAQVAEALKAMGWIDLNYTVAKRATYLGVTMGISPVRIDRSDLFLPTVCRYDFVTGRTQPNKNDHQKLFMKGSYTMTAAGGAEGETIDNLPIISTDGGYFSSFTSENTVGDALVSCAKRLGERAFNLALMPLPYSVSSYSANSESGAATEADELRQELYSRFVDALSANDMPDDKQFDCLIFGLYSDVNVVKRKKFDIPGVYLNVPSFMVFIRPTMLSAKSGKSIAEKIAELNGGMRHFIIPTSKKVNVEPKNTPGFNVQQTESIANKAQEYVVNNAVGKEKAINTESNVEKSTATSASTVSEYYGKSLISFNHEAALIYSLAFVNANKGLNAKLGNATVSVNAGFIKVAFKEFLEKGQPAKLSAIKAAILSSEVLLNSNKAIFNKAYAAIASLDNSVIKDVLMKAVNAGTGLSSQLPKSPEAKVEATKPNTVATEAVIKDHENVENVEETVTATPEQVMSINDIFGDSTKTESKKSTSPRGRNNRQRKSSTSSKSTVETKVETPVENTEELSLEDIDTTGIDVDSTTVVKRSSLNII